MREILFRAKRIDNGEWVEGLYTYCDGKHYIRFLTDETSRYTRGFFEVDPSTICQYTGLVDKDGKKILENDIVQYRDCTVENYVIAWESDKACFEYQQYGCSIMNFDELSGVEVEVIGNIFDNPDLLNE